MGINVISDESLLLWGILGLGYSNFIAKLTLKAVTL